MPKYDEDKLRYDLIDYTMEEGLAAVLTHGAAKYGANNWQAIENGPERYYAALRRHLAEHRDAMETNDASKIFDATGLLHLDHLICCAMFLRAFALRRQMVEDIRRSNLKDKLYLKCIGGYDDSKDLQRHED